MEKVFLIGGGGFIGKNLAVLLSKHYEIYIIDKYIDESFFAALPEVKTMRMDLVKEQVPVDYPNPDYILNLASIVSAARDMRLFDELISSNLKVLLNLFDRYKDLRSLKLFMQFGSSEEYGNYGSPFQETQREVPTSPYALVKQLAVNTALMLYMDYGFPTCAIRPGNVFGRYQSTDKFIPHVISKLKNNRPIDVTLCEQKRDCISVDDFCWCISELLVNYGKVIGEIINLGSGQSFALRDIIEYAKAYIGSSSVVNYGALPYRANEVMDLRCSEYKLASIIGKPIKFDFKKRLTEYIDSL